MKIFFSAVCCAGLFFAGLTASVAAADESQLYARCVRCHGEGGSKEPHVLKGQAPTAIVAKLKGYAEGTQGGSRKAVMTGVAKSLTDAEIEAVAKHIGTF